VILRTRRQFLPGQQLFRASVTSWSLLWRDCACLWSRLARWHPSGCQTEEGRAARSLEAVAWRAAEGWAGGRRRAGTVVLEAPLDRMSEILCFRHRLSLREEFEWAPAMRELEGAVV